MKCKAVMKKAKVPSVPGSDGIIDDVEEGSRCCSHYWLSCSLKICIWRRRPRNSSG